ncbi:transcription repressor OFP16-like [Arachis duranensis]|uniref:Transcription repressor n=1 Tax=Arachis duranensis TaxID=130453 RepID=A0A6P4DQR5_ARADU|nr:transcription repressor OFP16-like [Arachis duranensis]
MRRRRRNNLTHLDQCFSNFINPFILHQSQLSPNNNNSPPSSIVHHDRQINHNRPSSSTSIIKNFNTIYDNNTTEPEPEPEPEPADFATAFASQRFFFSSPGRSNSIVESTPSSSSSSSLTSSLTTTAPAEASSASAGDESKAVLFEGSVAVPTYSPDPYLDFRQSMEEMVEARPELMADVKSNWHVLQELLMCYLALNPKSTHKFILGAFADLLVTRMAFSDGGGGGGEE